MNDNTSSICLLNNTGMNVLIWQIGALLIPIIGLPGHFILIIAICNSRRHHFHPTSLYFISISITESIYLLFLFWDWLYVVNLLPDPRQILNCAFFYPVVNGTGYISLLLLAQLNIERIYIINKPQQTYSNLTYKRILIQIIFTFSTLFLFFFHYRFSLYYDSKAHVIYGQSCRVYEHACIWFYSLWPYIHLFCRLIPCLIIIYCTIYVCYNRCQRNSNRKTLLHRQQRTLSLILVFLSIHTLFAVIPIAILQFFNKQMWKYEIECFRSNDINQWKLLNTLCIIWASSIYMNKFYINFIFSSEFRYDVKRLILCRSTNKSKRKSCISINV